MVLRAIMKLDIKSRHIECDEELRDYVNRRAAFALSRFGPDVRAVEVTLEDVNGPRGGVDQRCKLIVTLKRESEPVVCETTHSELRTAVDLSFGRASRSVARTLDRRADRRVRSSSR